MRRCEFCHGDYPYYFCRQLENYGNSLTCADAPYLFGGWAEYLYLRPRTPIFHVPDGLPTNVAVLTELFAVTHSLDLAAKMPRPGGFREGDTVAVVGIGPVGIVHVAKASLDGRVTGDRHRPVRPAVALASTSAPPTPWSPAAPTLPPRPSFAISRRAAGSTSWSMPPVIRPASGRLCSCCAMAAR